MFEKLQNLITFLVFFSISIPFIAYAFARILINFIFQSINVLLLGINYLAYSLESYLAHQLKNNTRTAYQTLGEKHPTAYGFIFIKNLPYYALKALHATLIIALLLPLHIMVQSFAFLARKINLPTARNLISFVIAQTNDNDNEFPVKFFTEKDNKNGYWIFDQLASFDFWVSKNFHITKNKLVIPSQKESNIVNTSTDWIRKRLYNLNLITSVFKEIVSFSVSIVGTIVVRGLIMVLGIVWEISESLGIEEIIELFLGYLFNTLALPVLLFFGMVIDMEFKFIDDKGEYNYSRSLLYASFIALEYFVIRAIDTITEIISLPFRFLSQALHTLYELFTDQDFDYRKFDDSLHSYQLDQKDVSTKNVSNNIDTNDEIILNEACKTLS